MWLVIAMHPAVSTASVMKAESAHVKIMSKGLSVTSAKMEQLIFNKTINSAAVVVSGIKAQELKLMENNSSLCFVNCAEIIADSMLSRFFTDGGRTDFAVSHHLLCFNFLILKRLNVIPFVDNIILSLMKSSCVGPI